MMLDMLREAPEQDPDAIKVAEEKLKMAIELRNIMSEGKRNGGLCGGVNDPRVAKAQAVVDKLFNASVMDKDAIKAATKQLEYAIEMQQETRKGKSDGGRNGGKYRHTNEVFLIISITRLITLLCLYPHISVSVETLVGHATGTHVSQGKGKTPKGELTIACKDRIGELGRLKQSCGQLESKETFDANIAGYSRQGRIPRVRVSTYGKSKDEFSKEEKEEHRLARWIKKQKPTLTKLQNRLKTYAEEHPDEKDEVSKLLDDVRGRLAKVTKTWNTKRKSN